MTWLVQTGTITRSIRLRLRLVCRAPTLPFIQAPKRALVMSHVYAVSRIARVDAKTLQT